MRDNGIGLNERQAKFVKLVASGEVSVTEAYVLAGYGTKRDSSNANKLRKSLDSWITAERERLGLAPLGKEEESANDPREVAALIADQRRLYAMAIEKGETGTAQKCLRAIERLLRQPGKSGRPSAKPAPVVIPEPSANMFAHLSGAEVFELAYGLADDPDEERAEYEREVLRWAPYEAERAASINGLPNNWGTIGFPGARTRVIGETTVIDFEEPEITRASELKSSTAPAALIPVRRL